MDMQKQQEAKAKAEKILEVFKINGFQTTTESMNIMKKFSTFTSLKSELEKNKDLDISKLFDILDPVLVKETIENHVERVDGTDLDYEKDFIGDFETVFMLFVMTFQQLMEQSTGKSMGKPQEGIQSTKRALNV